MTKSNFFVAHYDWLALAVGILALAAGIVTYVGAIGIDADQLAREKLQTIERRGTAGEAVAPVDLTDFNRATQTAKNPISLSVVGDAEGSFLASEARVACTNCHNAVVMAKTCARCGAALVAEKPEDTDADGDGMPNDWERKYGLNPNDPADAELDKDGDTFTNLEEFEAKTNPVDKHDHPDCLNYLKVQLPLKETVLPFHFTGVYKTPSGLKFQFKDPTRAKEYDRGNYALLAGEEIGKSGFVPKEYVEKSKERAMGGGMKKKVDVSEAIVERKADGKRVTMTIHRKGVPVDVQAVLAYSRDGGKNFTVVPGDTIKLSGIEYVVKAIKKSGKGAIVTIAEKVSGKIRELSALES